jgi:hypothetical protein
MSTPAVSPTPQPPIPPLNLDHINSRIDKALAENRRHESSIKAMATAMFLLGVAVLAIGYWRQNVYIASPAVLLQGLLYWPIREIIRLRRESVALQTVPTIVSTMPAKEAAAEIRKLLQFLRGGRG